MTLENKAEHSGSIIRGGRGGGMIHAGQEFFQAIQAGLPFGGERAGGFLGLQFGHHIVCGRLDLGLALLLGEALDVGASQADEFEDGRAAVFAGCVSAGLIDGISGGLGHERLRADNQESCCEISNQFFHNIYFRQAASCICRYYKDRRLAPVKSYEIKEASPFELRALVQWRDQIEEQLSRTRQFVERATLPFARCQQSKLVQHLTVFIFPMD
jgi:hypothetical protein